MKRTKKIYPGGPPLIHVLGAGTPHSLRIKIYAGCLIGLFAVLSGSFAGYGGIPAAGAYIAENDVIQGKIKREVSGWAEFKASYESCIKAIEGGGGPQTLELKGTIQIPENFEFNPTTRQLTVNAGQFGFEIAGGAKVTVNNPELLIYGSRTPSQAGRAAAQEPDALIRVMDGGMLELNKGQFEAGNTAVLFVSETGKLMMQGDDRGELMLKCSSEGQKQPEAAIISHSLSLLELKNMTLETQRMNLEVQSAGNILVKGCHITAKSTSSKEIIKSQNGTVTAEGSTIEPPLEGSTKPSKGDITSIGRSEPSFMIGNIKKEQAVAQLPKEITVLVTEPSKAVVSMTFPVEWDTKTLPLIIDPGQGFLLNGRISDAAMNAAQITNLSSLKPSLNLIMIKPGAIDNLYGKAAVKNEFETEVELLFQCPNGNPKIYLDYSTDNQIWKTYGTDTDLWGAVIAPNGGQINPELIKANGEISMTLSLEIPKEKAVRGFWVRLRLEGSDHNGTSNACKFQPKVKAQGNSGSDTFWNEGYVQGGGTADENPVVRENAESEPESSVPESQEESSGSAGRSTKKGNGNQGGETDESDKPDDGNKDDGLNNDNGDSGSSGGGWSSSVSYRGRGRRGRSGGGGEMEDLPKQFPWIAAGIMVTVIVSGAAGTAVLCRRKKRKKEKEEEMWGLNEEEKK